jgi:hypothetical protein
MTDADHSPVDAATPGQLPEHPFPSPPVARPAPDDTTPTYLQPPRLGIIHLLAWMTVAAVLFNYDYSHVPANQVFVLKIGRIIGIFLEILNAAGLVGCGVLLSAKIRGMPGRLQPGHWLLFYGCLRLIEYRFQFPVQAEIALFLAGRVSPYTPGMVLFGISDKLLEIVAFLFFANLIPEHGRWRVFFRSWALAISLPSLLLFIVSWHSPDLFFTPPNRDVELWCPLLTIQSLMLGVVALLDLIRPSQRDWLHWLGICLCFWALNQVPIILLLNTLGWL